MPVVIGSLEEYVSVCCACGCALKPEEVSARMVGDFQDFDIRGPPQGASIVFCPSCKEKVQKYANDPVRTAWLRMHKLEHP